MDRNNTILIMYLSVLVVFITADSVDATYTAIPPTPAIQMINSSGGNVTATTYNDFVELVAGSGMTINMDNANNEIEFIASSSGLSGIYCTGTDKFKAYNATLNTFICDTDESSGAFPSNVAFTNQTNTFTESQIINGKLTVEHENVTNDYESFLIKHDSNSGGGYYVQADGGDKFVGVSGFDNIGGIGKTLYFGGGGWGVHDVNEHRIYTDPNNPTTGTNGGLLRVYIDEAGNVGIGGGTSLSHKLEVQSGDISIDSDQKLFLDGGTDVSIKHNSADSRVDVTEDIRVIKDGSVASVQVISYGSAATFTTRSSNGDQATPTNTLSGNLLSNNKADGHTGSSFSVGASFRAVATEDWSPTAKGTQWQFKTIPNNSTSLTTALTLDQDQSTILGGAFTVLRTSTASDVNTVKETIIGVTSTASPRTVTLDSDHVIDGRIYIIKDESGGAGTNNITIATEGSETIDGSATATISSNYGVVRVYSDGTNWFTY